jgi:hypothetical protein
MLVVAVAFAACSDEHESSSSGAAGMAGEQHAAGQSSQAGSESGGGGQPGEGGSSAAQGGNSAGQAGAPLSDAGQGGSGGTPDSSSCAGGQPSWWSSVTKSCQECPVKATVDCDEIVAGASYDVASSILTVQLPAGRAEIASAVLSVTFNYANGDPEQYADVNAAVAGDTLTFDFSGYGGSQISYLSGEPTIYDACGDYVVVHATGFGFGPAIMIQVPHDQGEGGAANGGASNGGASNGSDPRIDCGLTN